MKMDYEDMEQESRLFPWLDSDCMADETYDEGYCDESYDDDYYDDSMDGDHESGLASAGWGTDEDYGFYGGDDW
jgi:hypothetical protein